MLRALVSIIIGAAVTWSVRFYGVLGRWWGQRAETSAPCN
ncbi:hypothetical protein SPWS13_1041 [Shewanella putrefaciens]|nr:hypothetical protein SPWS13_1041 [Shewanella putrefaciens]